MFLKNTEKFFLKGLEKRKIPNSLTVHIIPTAHGLNWNSPKDIFLSVLKNELTFWDNQWPIGHVSLELHVDGEESIYMGQTAEKFSEFQEQLFHDHIGFGVLTDHVEGKLQDVKALKRDYGRAMTKKGKIAFATFKLPEDKCRKIKRYLEAYEEKKIWDKYGLYNDPLKGEGAGCSAFVSSCFRLIGLSDLAENWSRTIYIPYRLIGNPKHPVHIFSLFREGNLDWKNYTEPSYRIHFYDPELFGEWFHKVKDTEQVEERYQVEKSEGIILDYTKVSFSDEMDWEF